MFLGIGVLLIISAGIIYASKVLKEKDSLQNAPSANSYSNEQPIQQAGSLQLQANSEGEVQVTVGPFNISAKSPVWNFGISTNTHTVDITEDLMSVVELLDDKGSVYKPIGYQGDTSDHHRTGILDFKAISPFPASLELRIDKIGGIPTRTFKWTLNPE